MFYLNSNCWFCNKNTKVSYFKRNSWTCSHCEQYNGFNQEGDYNKEIPEMYKNPNESPSKTNKFLLLNQEKSKSKNYLCEKCTHHQKLKIQKLSEYQPRSEATYDLEIEIYKDYLEKIYELCDKCKSRVKFEITKQDGILKQYLYKLGKFDFLFERTGRFFKNKESKKSSKIEKPSSSAFIKILFYFLILLLCSLTLFYNDFKNLDEINEKVLNISELDHLIESLNFKLKSNNLENLIQNSKDSFESSLEFVLNKINLISFNKSSWSHFLNSCIPFNLIIIYFLCCILAVNQNHFGNTGLIWALDLVLILTNYKKYLKYFDKTSLEISRINLNFVSIIIPLIYLIILKEFLNNYFKNSPKKPTQLVKQSSNGASPFTSAVKLTNFNYSNKNSNIQCNYASVSSPNAYSLLKFLKSEEDQSMSSMNRAYSRSLIKPAKFKPFQSMSECIFQFKTSQNVPASEDSSQNSKNSQESDDDSSSIVSGLTNLYLDRSKETRCTSPKSEMSNFYSSFYQSNSPTSSKSSTQTEKSPKSLKVFNFLTVIIAVNVLLLSSVVYLIFS